METLVCKTCNTPTLEQAMFCHHCGGQIKCTQCQEPLLEGANNCIACGVPVSSSPQAEAVKFINQIKFRENKDERWYEINFTNDVGKEIKEVVADILKNKIGVNGQETAGDSFKSIHTTNISAKAEPLVAVPASEAGLIWNNPISEQATAEVKPEATAEVKPAYPHLNDLDVRLTCTENEWLLIYAFYTSGFGATTFAKDPVWQLYKDKRLTETRFKNLGTNWKSLFKKYLSTVKENEFKFTPAGLAKVKSLLLSEGGKPKAPPLPRKSELKTGKDANVNRKMPVSRKVMASSITPDEFDVYKNDRKISLEEFFAQKKPGNSNPNRIVTIAYYITKINFQEYFTEGNIDYAYRILNLGGKPVHLKQIITNLKNERIWFKKVIDQGTVGWRLTRQGEIYVEEKLLAS